MRPQDWAQPTTPTGSGGPMIFGVEAEGEGIGGVHTRAIDGTWTSALLGDTFKALHGVPGSATRVYGVKRDAAGAVATFWTSNDAGATWTEMTMPSGTDSSPNTDMSHHLAAPVDGTVYMAIGTDGIGNASTARGIWKSTDHGATWTRIVTFPAPTGQIRVGQIGVTATRLWYSWFDSYSGAPAQSCCFYAELDGSSPTTIPGVTQQAFNTAPSMRPVSDTTVLINQRTIEGLRRWTIGEGSTTSIAPSSGADCLDVSVLTESIFVALSYAPSPPAIWRTTDSGASWSQVFNFTEFALNANQDLRRMIDCVKSDPTKAFCFGTTNRNAGTPTFEDNTQFYVVVSSDQGATWAIEDVTSATPADPTVDLPIEYIWELAALG